MKTCDWYLELNQNRKPLNENNSWLLTTLGKYRTTFSIQDVYLKTSIYHKTLFH